MPIHTHVWVAFWILTSNVGLADLVFGVQSEFIDSAVRARLDDAIVLLVGRRTCYSQVVGSSPG